MDGFDVCNDSDQYVKFKELVSKLLDDALFWDLIKCTPRCKFTKYILKPMVESNYNDLLYKTGKSDGANLAVMKFKYVKNYPMHKIFSSFNNLMAKDFGLWSYAMITKII